MGNPSTWTMDLDLAAKLFEIVLLVKRTWARFAVTVILVPTSFEVYVSVYKVVAVIVLLSPPNKAEEPELPIKYWLSMLGIYDITDVGYCTLLS